MIHEWDMFHFPFKKCAIAGIANYSEWQKTLIWYTSIKSVTITQVVQKKKEIQ